MDIERLDQLGCLDWLLRAGCPDRLRQRRVTGRGRRRAMTMGYIGFTIFVAASGALIVWFWHRSYKAAKNARYGRYCKNGLPDDPIPPFKRTVSGLSEAELKRIISIRSRCLYLSNHTRTCLNNGNGHIFSIRGKKARHTEFFSD